MKKNVKERRNIKKVNGNLNATIVLMICLLLVCLSAISRLATSTNCVHRYEYGLGRATGYLGIFSFTIEAKKFKN